MAKNLLIIVSIFSFSFVTNDTAVFNGNDTVAQGIYDLAVVGRHQNSCTLKIDAFQQIHNFHELSGSKFPVGSSAINTLDC